MTALQPPIDQAAFASVSGDLAQTTSAANASEPAVSPKIWLAVAGATLGAFMAVLNIQIVNASLADIQGAIGAGIDDGGWISTSYLIAEIVVIPLSGWLAQVFSVRIYLLTNAILFLVLSVACAFAQNLSQMIVLRALQGFYRRRADPDGLYADHHPAAEGEAADRPGAVRVVRDLCAGDRPDHRRLSHRELGLAVHLLREPGTGRADDRHAVVFARKHADEPFAVTRGRLAGRHHHGDRSERAADRARGR